MAELMQLKERQFALGQQTATEIASSGSQTASPPPTEANDRELLPWNCEACLAAGNTEARCRVCQVRLFPHTHITTALPCESLGLHTAKLMLCSVLCVCRPGVAL